MFKRSSRKQNTDVTPREISIEAIEVDHGHRSPGVPEKSMPSQSETMDLHAAQHVSIISNDLMILGSDLKIISEGAIRVDGEIHGEICGVDVTVGRRGKVVGTVAGKRVIIDGEVSGEIQAGQVTLSSSSRVEGSVHHQSLSIDQGARFEGSAKRQEYVARLKPELEHHQPDALPAPPLELTDH